jgi:hypothetical protein
MRWVVVLMLLGACGDPPEDPQALRRDALELQAILGEDRSPVLMIDVENAVSARKPVYAAELIAGAVLPQVDAQGGRARSAELTTVTARKQQLRLVAAYHSPMGGGGAVSFPVTLVRQHDLRGL